jgi:hypothetical protein
MFGAVVDWVLDWMPHLFAITTMLSVLVAPLAIFRMSRVVAANLMMIASHIFGFGLWFWCAVSTFEYWGWLGVFIAVAIFGVGVIPAGFLALAIHSQWAVFLELAAVALSLVATRLLAIWCFGKAMKDQSRK